MKLKLTKLLILSLTAFTFHIAFASSIAEVEHSQAEGTTAKHAVSNEINNIVYKRKKLDNAYPMAASHHEDNFLKSLLGVGMKKAAAS